MKVFGKTRRFVMAVSLIVVLMASLVPVMAAKQVTLKVVIGPDTEDNRAQNQVTLERIKRFEAANPGVVCKPVPFSYTTRQDFFIKQASRTAPDMLDVWATECELLAGRKWIIPLDEYIKTWEKADWINPSAYDPFRYNGKIYGIPFSGYVKHIIYNKQMFRENGVPEPTLDWTWDDFLNAAVKCTDREKGIAGFAPMTRGGEGGWTLTDLIYQAGGECEVYENGKWKAVFDSPEAVTALQFLKDLKWKYDVLPADWNAGWTDVYNIFGSEKAAMVYDADWGRNVAINGQGMDPKDIGVAIMPKGPGPKGRQMGVQGGNFYVINALSSPEVQAAAWKWLTFELWDEADIQALANSAADYRAQKQYRAQFEYIPLKPDSPYVEGRAKVFRDNADVLLSWGSDGFLLKLPQTAHIEPPIEAQVLYAQFLAPAVQAVLSDQKADPARLLKDANARFQREYLDNVE